MSILEPGALVACINNRPILGRGNNHLDRLTLGQVYTVREVVDFGGGAGVRLQEIHLPDNPLTGAESAYVSTRFRPCKPTDISVFENMLHSCKLDKFKEQDQIKEAIRELEKVL